MPRRAFYRPIRMTLSRPLFLQIPLAGRIFYRVNGENDNTHSLWFQFEQQKHVRCAFFGKSLSLTALSECALCQFVVHNITSLNCALRPSILGKVRLHNYVLIHLTIAKCSVLTGLLITSHKSFYLSTNIAHDRQ